MTTQHRTHTQPQSKRGRGKHRRVKHIVAFIAAPITVFVAAFAVWTTLKQQCAALTTSECLPVGSIELGGTDVALLATFLSAGIAAMVVVATN